MRYNKLGAFCALLVLGGCSLLPTRTDIQTLIPPEHLLVECEVLPATPLSVNADLAQSLAAHRERLKECALRSRELKEWASEASPERGAWASEASTASP